MTDLAERRKRAINLSLNEALIEQARRYSSNLSATVEVLLVEYVKREREAHTERRHRADACVAGWNEMHAKVGSFADEHTTL